MKTAILVVVEQVNFGIGEPTNRYVKSVQKHIKFQRLKNAIQNINQKQKSSMLGCLKMAHNVSGIGEEAVSESSIELQIFKLKIKCQTKNKTAFLPIPC